VLARQGLLLDVRLATGDRVVLLRVEEANRYAGSLIIAARDHRHGVPALEIGEILGADFPFPRLEPQDRLNRREERILLECVVQLLIERRLALHHQGLLVFPAKFRLQAPVLDESRVHRVPLCYTFEGAIDNVYSLLVARLAVDGGFGPVRLWKNRAEFERAEGGVCGLLRTDKGRGFAQIEVYAGVDALHADAFREAVEQDLHDQGVDIREVLALACRACGYEFPQDGVLDLLTQGATEIHCVRGHVESLEGVQRAQKSLASVEKRAVRGWKTGLDTAWGRGLSGAVEDVRRTIRRPEVPAGEPLRILHLSDLHFEAGEGPYSALGPLMADLRDAGRGPAAPTGIERLDYLVVSGDLANRANAAGFDRAREFLENLVREFGLTPQQCILVPGNHDLDRDKVEYGWRPESQTPGEWKKEELRRGDGYLIPQEEQSPGRFEHFHRIYHQFLMQPYPEAPAEQGLCFAFPEIEFFTLNSAWQIDGVFPKRASIHPEALEKALRQAGGPAQDRLRIAVVHHAVSGDDRIPGEWYLERLAQAGVRVVLHGDVHEGRDTIWNPHDGSRKIYIAGAGSFAAGKEARPESIPRLYNLLEVRRDGLKIRVHTRRQDNKGGAWAAYAKWPTERAGELRGWYDIEVGSARSEATTKTPRHQESQKARSQ